MIELVTRWLRLTRRESRPEHKSPALGLPMPAVDREDVIDMCEVSCFVPTTGGRSTVIRCEISHMGDPPVISHEDGVVKVTI